MTQNLKIVRLKTKLKDLFYDLIDLSDIKQSEDIPNEFYTRAVAALAIVMKCGADYKTAAQCITDGYHDMGIDAVFNDPSQKKLIIVQSKWRERGTGSITQNELQSFGEGVTRCIDFDFDGCNSKLLSKEQEITEALKDIDYTIDMVFIHTGNQKANNYALRPINSILKKVNEDDSTELLSFSELILPEIYEYLANEQSFENIKIEDVELYNWGTVDLPYKAYYGTMPVSTIGMWYQTYGNRLFAENIRYYKGRTDVNQGIKEVLTKEPDKFFYYNNGIKILCKKISKKAIRSTSREVGFFVLEGVSVVNGAQTTGVIGAIYQDNPEILSDANILVQMIDLGEADDGQAKQITKLSNTQNKIDNKDFVALDPIQEKLRIDLSLSGIQYLYKTGSKIDNPSSQITLDEAIISQACMSGDLPLVALAKRNIGALTEDINKKPYKILFNASTNSFSLFNGIMVLRAVDDCIKHYENTVKGRKRLVLVHGNRFLLSLILERIKETDGFDSQYMSIEQIAEQTNAIFNEIWETVFISMEKHFPDSYPANIFKNVGRIKALLTE